MIVQLYIAYFGIPDDHKIHIPAKWMELSEFDNLRFLCMRSSHFLSMNQRISQRFSGSFGICQCRTDRVPSAIENDIFPDVRLNHFSEMLSVALPT